MVLPKGTGNTGKPSIAGARLGSVVASGWLSASPFIIEIDASDNLRKFSGVARGSKYGSLWFCRKGRAAQGLDGLSAHLSIIVIEQEVCLD